MKYIVLLLVFSIISCASYTISQRSLIAQLKENQDVSRTSNVASVGTNYTTNSISKIKCFDKNGNEVVIQANKNTTFEITNSTTGKAMTLYFDTVYISNDSLVGLKSRILGGKRSIALKDIGDIKVKTEN